MDNLLPTVYLIKKIMNSDTCYLHEKIIKSSSSLSIYLISYLYVCCVNLNLL